MKRASEQITPRVRGTSLEISRATARKSRRTKTIFQHPQRKEPKPQKPGTPCTTPKGRDTPRKHPWNSQGTTFHPRTPCALRRERFTAPLRDQTPGPPRNEGTTRCVPSSPSRPNFLSKICSPETQPNRKPPKHPKPYATRLHPTRRRKAHR